MIYQDGDDEGRALSRPFRSGYGEPDFCTHDGAQNLKAKIEAFWRERGQNVTVLLHNVGFHPAIRAARFDVRSDMVNGMPRRSGARSASRKVAEPAAELEAG